MKRVVKRKEVAKIEGRRKGRKVHRSNRYHTLQMHDYRYVKMKMAGEEAEGKEGVLQAVVRAEDAFLIDDLFVKFFVTFQTLQKQKATTTCNNNMKQQKNETTKKYNNDIQQQRQQQNATKTTFNNNNLRQQHETTIRCNNTQ